MAVTFPAFLQLGVANTDRAKSEFLAAVDSMTGEARARFSKFGDEVQSTVDKALSGPRNKLGAVDLGTAEYRAAAEAQTARAVAARTEANALALSARAENDKTAATRNAIAAAQGLATKEELAAQASRLQARAVVDSQNELNKLAISTERAAGGLASIASASRRSGEEIEKGSGRAGIAQFELLHVVRATTDSFAAGLPATTIFAEQIGRVGEAAAFAGAGGGLGALGSFLGGPWGVVVIGATAVLTPMIAKLFEASDAAKINADALGKVKLADDGLGEAQGVLAGMFDLATGALQRQNGMLRANAALVAAKLRADAISAGETARTDAYKAGQRSYRAVIGDNVPLYMMNNSRETNARANIEKVLAGKLTPDAAIRWAENQNFDRLNISRDEFMNAVLRAAEAPSKRHAADEITSALDTGKLATDLRKPATGRTRRAAGSTGGGTDNTDQLASLARRAADEIAAVNAQFDDQPTLVDKSAAAVRKLDNLIADLEKRKPPNYEKLVDQAKRAEAAARGFASVQIDKQVDQANKALAVQLLTLSGRDKEAAVLGATNAALKTYGDLGAANLERVKAQAAAEYEVNLAIQKRAAVQSLYLDAVRSVRSETEAILSGTGKFSNLTATFAQLRGKLLTEQLFGDAFRKLDSFVKSNTGLDSATDHLVSQSGRAGDAAGTLADALSGAAAIIAGLTPASAIPALQSNGVGLTDLSGGVKNALSAASILGGASNDNGDPNAIVVNGRLPRQAITALGSGLTKPTLTVDGFAHAIAAQWVAAIRDTGIKLSPQAAGVLTGGFAGALQFGPAGGVLGALREIPNLPTSISKGLNGAFKGLGIGDTVSNVAGAFGIHLNKTGSQIGGAIGKFIPIPGGEIIGAIIGGVIGNLVSVKTGSAALGRNAYGSAGVIGTGGNNAGATASATGLGGQVGNQINQIADALGAKVGNFAVAIGQRNDQYRVSGSGSQSNTTSKKPGSDVIYKGKDPQAAIAAAVQNAIQDGAISGISAASQVILKSGQDLNVAIQKAVAIENIPKALKQLTDPVGAAVDALNQQFSKLISYLQEGGATAEQYTQAQKLYDLQRATAIKQAAEQLTSGLKGLYDSLTVGNSALSLKDRKDQALATFNPLEARVNAGDTTAYADFVTAANTLIDIERQLSGSQTGYFELQQRIVGDTKGQIDLQKSLADAATASDSPFNTSNVTSAINDQTGALGAKLDAVNANLIALGQLSIASGGRAAIGFASASSSYF